MRRFGSAGERQPKLLLAARSDIDLPHQVTAAGATWLYHRLVEHEPTPLAMGGFGREVRDAMTARAEHLAAKGLARRQGQFVVLQRDLLASLQRRELDAAGAKLSGDTGLPYTPAAVGETVAGVYRQRLTLTSGRFAMIDDGLGFQLVPWSLSLDQQLGHHVTGVAKDGGGIEWGFGRKRELGL